MRWGVSVRRTSLRAKPTDALCPTRAGDRYDDALQLTAVLPNEPMALLGESADGRFCYAETSYYAGWVPAEDIGLCRDLEAWRTAQEGGFLRVTGSRVTLCCDPYEPRVSGATLPMGTSLPLAASPGTVRALRGRMSYDNYLVRLPVRRADGWLEYREAMVPVSADVCVGDLPYTHENVTAQAAKMRGEVYGWGGMLGGRDCSAGGDVYRCFGFPPAARRRRAGAAARRGGRCRLSTEEKRAARCTLPVGTILYFPGHHAQLGCGGRRAAVRERGGKFSAAGERGRRAARGEHRRGDAADGGAGERQKRGWSRSPRSSASHGRNGDGACRLSLSIQFHGKRSHGKMRGGAASKTRGACVSGWKGEAAAPQRRRCSRARGCRIAVAEQRMAARGELAANLVKASRVQRDAHEGGRRAVECGGLQHAIVEQGFL